MVADTTPKMPQPATSPSVPLLIGLIRLVRERCQRHERQMCRELALTSSQLTCLLAVPDQEFNVNQAAEAMELSPSRASRVLDSLVRQGLLYRRTADRDRRTQLLELTPAGRKKWQEARNFLEDCEQKLLAKLTAENSQELEGLLRALVDIWPTNVS